MHTNTDRQTETQRDMHTNTDRQTDRQRHRETCTQTQTDRDTDTVKRFMEMALPATPRGR